MSELLTVEGVSKSFGGLRVLDGISLRVAEGETFGLIGPNGAGKTTLFNVLTGYIRPDSGRVMLNGLDITGYPPHRICGVGVGRTFQITKVFPSMTAFENVMVGVQCGRRQNLNMIWPAKRLARDKTEGLLELVGLGGSHGVRAQALSYPDQKRLELAVALAADPCVLLLDEPTAGMSAQARTAILQAVQRVKVARPVTIVLIEHDISCVFSLCHRIAVLHQGDVISLGSPDVVREDSRVQEVYLGASVDA